MERIQLNSHELAKKENKCLFMKCSEKIQFDWKCPATLKKEPFRDLERELGARTWKYGFFNIKSLEGL